MPWYDNQRDFDRSSFDYPGTGFFIGSPNKRARAGGKGDINQIVIHITGGPGVTESSAVNRFLGAGASAHYIVNRQGKIVQMVRDEDIANHIRNMNYHVSKHSVGIEHVNSWLRGNQQHPTRLQYEASAALVQWLCYQYGVPIRHHPNPHESGIKGHMEADQNTGHTTCPNPAWDWDSYIKIVRSGVCS